MDKKSKFEEAYSIDVNHKTEKKDGLTYLSWAWAWAEFKKIYPDAVYSVRMFDGKPFTYDEALGYMVFTEVTADNITHEMWLPVMNGSNKAMKASSYQYTTRYGNKTVEAATMFDVNKTLMRCLTKNLAMFGLGLYIYAGEDMPEAPIESFKAEVDAIETVEALREYYKQNKGKGKELDAYILAKGEELKKKA